MLVHMSAELSGVLCCCDAYGRWLSAGYGVALPF
jgi:hypothetical protein